MTQENYGYEYLRNFSKELEEQINSLNAKIAELKTEIEFMKG